LLRRPTSRKRGGQKRKKKGRNGYTFFRDAREVGGKEKRETSESGKLERKKGRGKKKAGGFA